MCFGKYQTWWRNLFHITQAWRSIKLVRRVCLQFMRHHYMCTKNCLYIVIALSLIHKFVISFYKCTHLMFYKLCQLKKLLQFSIKILYASIHTESALFFDQKDLQPNGWRYKWTVEKEWNISVDLNGWQKLGYNIF